MWERWVGKVNCYLGHYETKVSVLVENVLVRVIIVLMSENKLNETIKETIENKIKDSDEEW